MVTKKLKLKATPIKVPYMVLVSGQGEPRVVHDSFEDATKEAKRLSIVNPTRLVRVLEIKTQYEGKVRPAEVPYKFPEPSPDVDDLPF